MKLIDRKIDEMQETDPSFNAARMASNMHIDPSLFSKWRVEDQGVNKETLTSMVLGYSNDETERSQILAAYAIDQIRGRPGSDQVEISVVTERKVNDGHGKYGADEFDGLAAAARAGAIDKKALAALVKIVKGLGENPDLRRVLISLSKMT